MSFDFNGLAIQTISWEPADSISQINNNIPTFNLTTPQYIYVTILDSSGCVIRDSAFVDISPIVTVTPLATADELVILEGTSTQLHASPNGYNYSWQPFGSLDDGSAQHPIAEMIDMGGQEKDYRDEGGFVAMGGEERADDVPARLSKNEFVFTADAVRNAGGGDIDRGSEVMQNLMDNLEQGGQVSEDSQGLGGEEMMMSEEMIEEPNGAQAMYEQQQALQSRMI